ncbi:alpha/beta fold hydrolase [Actinoplanes bogorensis]|uniref:Alpha/beta fold hydrolase n=1 Tax=Paractinoplanes bogorensis TaxID=1610840 RepID=A0ABS5Z5I4_9ACTN|nr:alpha/beta fold hydrolase [Actinoplanes bogorensis]
MRFDDWTDPVRPVERELISLTEDANKDLPPVLFVPGLGHGAWAFAEHWLPAAAARGFAAHALTPRPGGSRRAQVHDVVQVAASLPRQTVLIGHGAGALVVAYAMGRYPVRAAVLAAPVMDGWPTLWTALKTNPLGTLPAVFGGRLRLNRKQLFSAGLPDERAREILDRVVARPRRELVVHDPAPRPVGDPPVLVVGSPDDRVVPRSSLDRTATRYGGAPLLFPGMGHDLMLDVDQAEPIEAILDWLTKELGTGG